MVSSSGTALTPDQIRLINRLTKNITVLFDGDPAGIRAALRGIDLILEQGMNVKICTFPEGEDPDSFAKQNTLEELQTYLKENAKDFIAYKASLLMEEAQNDPVAKANLIRDMVTSISKVRIIFNVKYMYGNVHVLWILAKKCFLVRWLKWVKKRKMTPINPTIKNKKLLRL